MEACTNRWTTNRFKVEYNNQNPDFNPICSKIYGNFINWKFDIVTTAGSMVYPGIITSIGATWAQAVCKNKI